VCDARKDDPPDTPARGDTGTARLVTEDDIHGERQLALLRTQVVGRHVVGMFEAQFRADDDGATHPVPKHKGIFRIYRFVPGALPLLSSRISLRMEM
jgi:hypothetical protein